MTREKRAALLAGLLAGAAALLVLRGKPAPPPLPEVPERDPPAPETTESAPRVEGFRDVARGVRVAELERAYDDERARVVIARVTLAEVSLTVEPLERLRLETIYPREDALVVINGGFFEPSFEPSGLAVSGARTLSPERQRGGSGVLVVRDDIARLLAFPAGEGAVGASFAVQCGPRLVEPDGSLGIRSDTPERARRSALCVRDGGRVIDIVAAEHVTGRGGPGLLAFASWLHAGLPEGEPPCESALNLDGGPSTGIRVRAAPSAKIVPFGPVVQAVVVRARAASAP